MFVANYLVDKCLMNVTCLGLQMYFFFAALVKWYSGKGKKLFIISNCVSYRRQQFYLGCVEVRGKTEFY